jgi:predicted HAD superfamily hydrolase
MNSIVKVKHFAQEFVHITDCFIETQKRQLYAQIELLTLAKESTNNEAKVIRSGLYVLS